MSKIVQLALEKFGSLGGDYFEHIVAIALDELGYSEGESYVPSWANRCVPGTWIEADFIISNRNDKTKDPVKNGRIVLAIGHATSENSAGMKFHRDVEQLLEVKSLPQGDEYRVIDILFCCPRETMGGWSKELVAINEAIFDDHVIVWNHDWGVRLLQQIQQHGEKLKVGDAAQKKKRLKKLLNEHPAFRKQFESFRHHFKEVIEGKSSKSKILDIFKGERKVRDARLTMPLLATGDEKTDFKRGLVQMLALNDKELVLLYENHKQNSLKVPLEKLALDRGMSSKDFEIWWQRLDLLAVKLGDCSYDFVEMPLLDEDARKWRFFSVSPVMAYIFDRFSVEALQGMLARIAETSPNLATYRLDLNTDSRIDRMLDFIEANIGRASFRSFYALVEEHFNQGTALGMQVQRLSLLEVGMAVICSMRSDFSYDKLCKETGHPDLVSSSNNFRRFPKMQGSPSDKRLKLGIMALWKRLRKLGATTIHSNRRSIKRKFIERSLDGMGKQPRADQGALDILLGESIRVFNKEISAKLTVAADQQGIRSAFNVFTTGSSSGVNVEIPYVLHLLDDRKILIHRVNANDGHAADKRKEFSSKIRTVRYCPGLGGTFALNKDIYSTILVVDGNWTGDGMDGPLTHLRMLTVAGWDFVVFPDQLSKAFDRIKTRLHRDGLLKTKNED